MEDLQYRSNGATLIPRSDGQAVVSPAGRVAVFTKRPVDVVFSVQAVVSLNSDGQRDTAFEQRVAAALDCGGDAGSFPDALSVTPEGKLLLAARSTVAGRQQLCVFRLNEDGGRDATFASNGRLIVQNAIFATHFPFRILLRSDGRILIVLLDAPPMQLHRPALL
jgi:Domain of unknown function (DUF5122) beta-propeller